MVKAFIFDMDGVIVDSERQWEDEDRLFLTKFFGEKVYEEIKDKLIGNSLKNFHKMLIERGLGIEYDELEKLYAQPGKNVYTKAPITQGLEEFAAYIIKSGYKIGVVSSSRQEWIDIVLDKLSFRSSIEIAISVNDTPGLKSKPAPDGYIEAMKVLGATPQNTIVLEDSEIGVKAAMDSGAYTICLTQNHLPGYFVSSTDVYVKSFDSLLNLFKKIKN